MLFELFPNLQEKIYGMVNQPCFQRTQSKEIHSDRITNIEIFDKKIFSASFDRSISLTQIEDLTTTTKVYHGANSVSSFVFDDQEQNLYTGDPTGTIRIFGADGCAIGKVGGLYAPAILAIYVDQVLKLLWVVLSDGTLNLIDPTFQGGPVTKYFSFFDDLPFAGGVSNRYDYVFGNHIHNHILTVVNKKYVFAFQWSEHIFSLKYTPAEIIPKKLASLTYESGSKVRLSHFEPGFNIFISGNNTNYLRPLRPFIYEEVPLIQEKNSTCIEYFDSQYTLFIGYIDGLIIRFILNQKKVEKDYHPTGHSIVSFLFTDNNLLAICKDMSISFWNLKSELKMMNIRYRVHDHEIVGAAINGEQNLFFTADKKGFCRMWEIVDWNFTLKEIIDLSSNTGINAVVFSETPSMWIIACANGFIYGLKTKTPNDPPIFNFSCRPCFITTISIGLDHDLFVATNDFTIRLIDLELGQEISIFRGHTNLISDVNVSKGSDRWCSVQYDGVVYFWYHLGKSPKVHLREIVPSDLKKKKKVSSDNSLRSKSLSDSNLTIYDRARREFLCQRKKQEKEKRASRLTPEYKALTKVQSFIAQIMDHK